MSVQTGETHLTPVLNEDEPSEELLEWAKENINEDPDKKDELISELANMIFERGECNPHRTDDEFLLRFLRARHFITRKAHRLIANFYDFKDSNPQYFQNVDVFRVRELAKTEIFSVPPYRDQHGRRMLIVRFGLWNPSEFSIPEMVQLASVLLQMAVLEPQSQIKGAVLVIDLSELTLNATWHLTPTIAKHFVSLAMTSFPVRLEAVHVLYSSWIFDMVWSMFKQLISETVRDRIYFHGDDMENLHTHIAPKHLPERYGGVHEDFPMIAWFDVLLKNERAVNEFVQMGYEDIRLLVEEGSSKTK